jgi:import inner membrane translocase subunit TIM16
MALGPIARVLAQVVVPVVNVLARALPEAYAQALNNARRAGIDSQTAAAASALGRKRISQTESLQILNLSEEEATVEVIQKVRVPDVNPSS